MKHLILLSSLLAFGADPNLPELSKNASQLRSTFKPDDLRKGLAYLTDHETGLFALDTDRTPSLVTDDDKPVPMTRVEGSLWSAVAKLEPGRSHQFHYVIDGATFGGRLDIPVFLPESYEQP